MGVRVETAGQPEVGLLDVGGAGGAGEPEDFEVGLRLQALPGLEDLAPSLGR
jgi:hypothetical protein